MNVEVRSPFPFESLPRIWRWMEPFRAKISDDFSPKTMSAFLASIEPKLEGPGVKSWAVYGDGELGGLITYEELTPWVGTAHFLLKPEFQRQGLSVKAARIAVAEMFAEQRIHKLVFYPLAGNLAIGSLLINIGAKREGTLAAHTVCGGKPTDMWVYGLVREGLKQHAGASNRSGDRGAQLDLRECPVRTAQDHDEHHDSDLVAPDAGPREPTLELQLGADVGSKCGALAD